jgi:POT family proton-dependent oligopeptide transporter
MIFFRFGKSTQTDKWAAVKPSVLGANKPVWMDFDDAWVDEVRRGLLACRVFLWYPLYCM